MNQQQLLNVNGILIIKGESSESGMEMMTMSLIGFMMVKN